MQTVRYATWFKRDYRFEKSGRHGKKPDPQMMEIVNMLATDKAPPRRAFDHPLTDAWSHHRDCHIRPDLVLIYRKPDGASLALDGASSAPQRFGLIDHPP